MNIRYQAPEMCQLGTKETFETDIYAYGGVLNFIWTKEYPWSQVKNSRIAQSQIIKLQTENKSPRISNNSILKNNNTCLQHCWSPTPNNRPKISECVREVTKMFESKQGLSPIEYCQQNPNKDDQICYRLLRYHEDPTKGLVAKKPNNTTCSILNHVNDGSKLNFQGSPFILLILNVIIVVGIHVIMCLLY